MKSFLLIRSINGNQKRQLLQFFFPYIYIHTYVTDNLHTWQTTIQFEGTAKTIEFISMPFLLFFFVQCRHIDRFISLVSCNDIRSGRLFSIVATSLTIRSGRWRTNAFHVHFHACVDCQPLQKECVSMTLVQVVELYTVTNATKINVNNL